MFLRLARDSAALVGTHSSHVGTHSSDITAHGRKSVVRTKVFRLADINVGSGQMCFRLPDKVAPHMFLRDRTKDI